jgi:diadenosine tetraphosphate (Ap4A) HIT family hydrolase
MENITNYQGVNKKISCLGCDRENGKINLGDIVKSKYFDAHQDYEIPIPGFIIISSRRHILSVDQFTKREQVDFIKFFIKIRKALRKVLKIKVVYLIQEEDTSHHFHLWILPRYSWMGKKFGQKIESVRPIMLYAKKNFATKKDLIKVNKSVIKLKKILNK